LSYNIFLVWEYREVNKYISPQHARPGLRLRLFHAELAVCRTYTDGLACACVCFTPSLRCAAPTQTLSNAVARCFLNKYYGGQFVRQTCG
jgi:hypothetical protein